MPPAVPGDSLLPSYPITQVAWCSERMVAAFADFTKVTIVDRAGQLGVSPRVGGDGVRITQMSANEVEGYWDSPLDSEVPFTLNLVDRTVRGGATIPPHMM